MFELENLTVDVLWSQEDGLFIARCREFPSLSAYGTTEEQAREELLAVVDEELSMIGDE